MTVGETAHCAVQGVYQQDRVLTLQGHCEFDGFVNREIFGLYFGGVWDEDDLERVVRGVEGEDDKEMVAEMIVGSFSG